MNEHTPEPWLAYVGPINMEGGLNPFFRGTVAILKHSGEGDDVAVILDRNEPAHSYEANARRIVACINACKGETTEDLEKCAEGAVVLTVDSVLQDVVTAIEESDAAVALKEEYRAQWNATAEVRNEYARSLIAAERLLQDRERIFHDSMAAMGGEIANMHDDIRIVKTRLRVLESENGALAGELLALREAVVAEGHDVLQSAALALRDARIAKETQT